MHFGRILVIATNGFREVIRDRILYFLGFFILLLVIAFRLLPEISATTEDKIFLDFGLAMIGLLNTIIAIFVGTGLVNKEIDKRTVLVMLPKPISRAEFILGKHVGLFGVLTVLVTMMSLAYWGFLELSEITYPWETILVSLVYLLIELSLLTAVAITFSVFTSSTLATLLSFGIYFVGHFSRDLVKLGKLSENESLQWLTENLYLVLPDLSKLNLRNEAVYGLLPNSLDLVNDALYGIVYTAILLAVAILIFSQREF